MTNVILDTNIIIAYPKLLGLKNSDLHFVIPIDVIFELNARANNAGKGYDDRAGLIEKSAAQGLVSIINTELPGYRTYLQSLETGRLSLADANIVAVALYYASEKGDTKIATLDKEIQRIARLHEIEVLTKENIEELISSFENPLSKLSLPEQTAEVVKSVFIEIALSFFPFGKLLFRTKIPEILSIQGAIAFFERKQTINIIVGILIGIALTVLAFVVYFNLDLIIATINIWGTIILVILSGILLFIFREKQRFRYGIFEFSIGIVSIILLFQNKQFNFHQIKFDMDVSVKL
jgi:predicted nucleic acid-binding protein